MEPVSQFNIAHTCKTGAASVHSDRGTRLQPAAWRHRHRTRCCRHSTGIGARLGQTLHGGAAMETKKSENQHNNRPTNGEVHRCREPVPVPVQCS